MKKISNLGKVLSRDEAKKIVGGDYGEQGCWGPHGDAFCRAANWCDWCSNATTIYNPDGTISWGAGVCVTDPNRCGEA